jgi:hypothetical protein
MSSRERLNIAVDSLLARGTVDVGDGENQSVCERFQ